MNVIFISLLCTFGFQLVKIGNPSESYNCCSFLEKCCYNIDHIHAISGVLLSVAFVLIFMRIFSFYFILFRHILFGDIVDEIVLHFRLGQVEVP